ncbi:ribonuclease Z [Thermophagus xiamenensis]|uniref:Ribonuclease Z n=1 Tax=Thermophagus xiamenensis TaxID=385682 RepID=A0A1I2D8V1_9BACT|nr:ribonuclease Z [Thermophagus xiamenensis]SFE76871.1 ribonuclease Z [Thermophagus xiamenensis]
MGLSVTILGSNSALPTSERNPTAQVLRASGRFFLIDCGEGTQLQLRRNRVHFGRIHHIFISHLHGDHVFGLPGLISSLALLGRTADLHVYAMADLEKLLNPWLDYFCKNMPFVVVFHAVEPDVSKVIYEDELLEVVTIPLEHRIPTVGFLFREKPKERKINKGKCDFYQIPLRWLPRLKKGEDFNEDGRFISNEELTLPPPPAKSYAFCSDTRYSEKIVSLLQNVDLLYHESTFLTDQEELAAKTFHSTARQAASIAHQANVGKLLLGHFSSRYRDLEPFLEEARAVFDNAWIATEGSTFEI